MEGGVVAEHDDFSVGRDEVVADLAAVDGRAVGHGVGRAALDERAVRGGDSVLHLTLRGDIDLAVMGDEPTVLGLAPPIRVPVYDMLLQEVTVVELAVLDLTLLGDVNRAAIRRVGDEPTALGLLAPIRVP